jgi:multiple sugar transport system permease protein
MLAPYLLGVLLLVIVPGGIAFGLAFTHYNGLAPPRWAGLANLPLALGKELFEVGVKNSLILTTLAVPLRLAGALLAAMLLRDAGRGLGLLRALVFLPSVVPGAAWAVAWLWILNPLYGPLNLLLRAVGLDPPAWFADPLWARPGIVLMSLWQIGEGFLVCLAALLAVPPDLDEAARVDGAGAWRRFGAITLPLVAPWLLLLAARDVAVLAQESYVSIALTTGGGPYYATYTLPFFVQEQAFDLLAFGVAGVGLLALLLLTALLVAAAAGAAVLLGVELFDADGLV